MKSFNIVQVDYKYCDFLRKFDERVPYNYGKKELRPFIGILFEVGEVEYFAPLSSPKKKHLTMEDGVDFIKIDKGKLGAINFNNMLPLIKSSYEIIKIEEMEDINYRKLLTKQIRWLNRYYDSICHKAKRLYNSYKYDQLSFNVKRRCCNFLLLEEKSIKYNDRIVN